MDTAVYTENSVDILTLARQQGYILSSLQLVRWHRAGLLPRPRQFPLKGVRGTCSLYPIGTREQVLLLCALRARERRFAHLAWQLWLEGYSVRDVYVRTLLQQAATRLSDWMRWFAAFKQTLLQHEAEQGLDLLERYAEEPLRWQPLRRARKRVGRAHFSTFLALLLELASQNSREPIGIDDEYERQFDLRLLARGLGLEKRFVRQKAALEYYLLNFLLPQLRWFLCWAQEIRWEELPEQKDYFELLQARDDLRNWLMRLKNARRFQAQLPEDYPRWEIDHQEIFHSLPVQDQALVLVIWLALRDDLLPENMGIPYLS